MSYTPRLVVVSNRLPIAIARDGDDWSVKAGSGGLVSALAPMLSHRGGRWIGWPGLASEEGADWERLIAEGSAESGYELQHVLLDRREVSDFYEGFANEVLWPLFHNLLGRCVYRPRYWHAYIAANQKYARAVADLSDPRDFVWVHDYHLIHLGQHLRRLGVKRRLGFFLHIPFPPLDILLQLPWRADILRALLSFDLLGFQTYGDRRRFLFCVEHLLPQVKLRKRGAIAEAQVRNRTVHMGHFPIGMDYKGFQKEARSEEVASRAEELREELGGRRIILGVDRLDYTKGLPERIRAFRNALERYPELRGKVQLVQLAVPSRQDVEEYRTLRSEIDELVGQVNGRFGSIGWVPIKYLLRTLPRQELLALYRIADVALVTPLKDGMNLVAKEFCACQVDEPGVLVLSEFAGAAAQLKDGAMLVNPHNIEGMADAIHGALELPVAERRRRMRKMQESCRRHNIHWWVDRYLKAAIGRTLRELSTEPEYVPKFSMPR
jgi:trehalose 6-phosphate synthase/phosphatase